jgi:fructokinase
LYEVMSFRVVGLGEVLWDLLPDGPQLGGAPANFAYHANALGARAQVLTRIGNDRFGHEILERFKAMELPPGTVQLDDQAPTGTVTVTLNGNGVPHFVIHENVAWDRLEITKSATDAVRQADAICFGTLAQREPASRATIQRLVSASSANALRVFDINLRQQFYSREIIEQSLVLANVVKLNDVELPILTEIFRLGDSPEQQMEKLAREFGLRLVALTRGPNGSLLFQRDRWSQQPPLPVQVVDTVGAGDAFTAALVMGLLAEMDLDAVHAAAAEVAGYVCTQAGATPALPPQFSKKYAAAGHRHPDPLGSALAARLSKTSAV